MLTIACVQTSNYCKRGREYVRILRASVERNLSLPYEFFCLTDDPFDLRRARFWKITSDLGGWWNKLKLFSILKHDTTLYLDLDTIITGPLDDIAQLNSNFAALRDFYRPEGLGSGVMLWQGDHSSIYKTWRKIGRPKYPGGDQEWLEQVRAYCDRLQERLPGKICSIKPWGQGRLLPEVPRGTSIVCCHGTPKPHELDGMWKDYWHE